MPYTNYKIKNNNIIKICFPPKYIMLWWNSYPVIHFPQLDDVFTITLMADNTAIKRCEAWGYIKIISSEILPDNNMTRYVFSYTQAGINYITIEEL